LQSLLQSTLAKKPRTANGKSESELSASQPDDIVDARLVAQSGADGRDEFLIVDLSLFAMRQIAAIRWRVPRIVRCEIRP
jgi:hypothetical protein